MNQLRLLMTGKSLVGLTQSESHYRVTRARFLPQFGPARNSSSPQEGAAPAPMNARPRDPRAGALPQESANLTREATRVPAGDSAVAVPRPPTGLTTMPKSGTRSWATGLWVTWADKLRAMFSRPVANPAKVAYPAKIKLPVQGELSLDRIKVVRNDLSDADLEIVPLKSPTARPGATPVLQVTERTSQAALGWTRVSGLFGVSKT
jgi:hypothetical protein